MLDQKVKLDKDARREAIIDMASEIFLEEGFDGASMSTIAARLGGSKGTLYNYFKSKEDLFEAYVQRNCVMHKSEINELLAAETSDYRHSLTIIGRKYLRIVTSDSTLRNYRLISAVSQRWPEIGKLFYEAGPLRGAQMLSEYLTKAAAAGEFTFTDPLRAAHQFIALCQNRHQKARFMNYVPEPTDALINEEVDAAVDMFYAAYGRKA